MPSNRLRKWSAVEDKILLNSVRESEAKGESPDYKRISKYIPERSPKQCRERYENSLQPDVKRGEWSLEETVALAKLMTDFGQNWAVVKEQLTNRTYNAIKKKGRKLLGEIVDRNCIPQGSKSKATACWTEREFESLLEFHLDETLVERERSDYLALALKLRTGRSEAEVERQLLQHCTCPSCTEDNYAILSLDCGEFYALESISFKDRWSLWKSAQVLGSLEHCEKSRFNNKRRPSTTSTSSDSTMVSSFSESSKRRKLSHADSWACPKEEEHVFDLNVQSQEDDWFNIAADLHIKQEPDFWPTFEWEGEALKDLDGNFLFPL